MKGIGTVVGVVLLMILTTNFLKPIQKLYDENPVIVIAGIIIIIISAYTIVSLRKKYLERKSK
jgi:hypothetical protein